MIKNIFLMSIVFLFYSCNESDKLIDSIQSKKSFEVKKDSLLISLEMPPKSQCYLHA
jgi:hypothetical protein